MSDMTNYVILSDTLDTVTKYSPKNYVDFSIELEYTILEKLQHLDIVPILKDFTFDEQDSSFVMTKINGTLLNVIMENPMSKQEIFDLLLNILGAIGEIHTEKVTHGDIHGDNIMLVKTENGVNAWHVNGTEYLFPSHGLKPYIIDFGLGYMENIPFKADLSVTESGYITGIEENKFGDVVSFLETISYVEEITPLFDTFLNTFIKTTPNFIPIDDKITRWLKNHSFAKKHHYKFFTCEMYNLVRCFPQSVEKDLDKQLSKFLKYLDKQAKKFKTQNVDVTQSVLEQIKTSHYEDIGKAGLEAGSFVINQLVSKFKTPIVGLVKERYKLFPFNNVESAISHFQSKYEKFIA